MDSEAAVGSHQIRFKSKKRKTLRQRDDDDAAAVPSPNTRQTASASASATAETAETTAQILTTAPGGDENDTSAVQEALRRRQARSSKNRFRRAGVGFRRDQQGRADGYDYDDDDADIDSLIKNIMSSGGGNTDDADAMGALVPVKDNVGPAVHHLPDRFMHQTGFVADADDRHMMEYIESRLSTRAAAAAAATTGGHNEGEEEDEGGAGSSNAERGWGLSHSADYTSARRQGAPGTMQTGQSTTSWTRLVEVEVPADRRRGREGIDADGKTKQQQQQDAAPAGRRKRNRRGSDDIKRDEMVEAFLRENKINVNKIPPVPPAPHQHPNQHANSSGTRRHGRTSDDTLADNFRRQYMAEMAARRQRRRPAINQPRFTQKQLLHQQAVAAGEVLKGPKLGGSRNSRAAVRQALLQQQEQNKRK